MNVSINSKAQRIAEKIFLALFALYTVLGSNSFTYGAGVISFVMWPTMLLGAAIVLYRLLHYKQYYKMPGLLWLVGLFASICISTVVNYTYSLKENVVFCIYWSLFFFVLYTIKSGTSIQQVKKDFHLAGGVFVGYTLVSVIISFVLMFAGYSMKIIAPDSGMEYYRGFSIGRLWGTFLNPNHGAISAAVAILLLIYFAVRTKKIWARALYGFAVFLEFMFIALSDSRTGAVCIGVGLFVFLLLYFLFSQKDKKLHIKLACIALSLVIGLGGFALSRWLKEGYNQVVTFITPSGEENDLLIERGYDLSGDISNRRFDLWGGAVQLYVGSTKGLAVGYSYKGFTAQTELLQPDNYIVNNDSGKFNVIENEIFNIMVAQGSVGLLALAGFVATVLVLLFRRFCAVKKENWHFMALLLGIVLLLAAAAMFGALMFYHFSWNTLVFWIALGSMMYVLQHSKGDGKDAKAD